MQRGSGKKKSWCLKEQPSILEEFAKAQAIKFWIWAALIHFKKDQTYLG